MNQIEKFYQKVNKTDTCWLWTGGQAGGYGVTSIGSKTYFAHRASVILHGGTIPPKMCVCHKCDVPLCVRPDHLFIGTHKENTHDAIRKGRFKPFPVKNCTPRKLEQWQADFIRREVAAGKQATPLARQFGVSKSLVSKIVHNERYV